MGSVRRAVCFGAVLIAACAAPSQSAQGPSSGPSAEIVAASPTQRVALTDQSSLVLLDVVSARELITRDDEFLRALTPLDRRLRLEREQAVEPSELVAHLAAQVRSFTPVQVARLRNAASRIGLGLERAGIVGAIPAEIRVVLTTGGEEGSRSRALSYTRSGAIYLNEPALADDPSFLLAHELFHVISWAHPDKQRELYARVGFFPLAMTLPKALEERFVTSPEMPRPTHAIRVRYRGREVLAVPLSLVSAPGQAPLRIESVSEYFLVLEPTFAGGELPTDAPLVSFFELSGLLDQVGRNTGYLAGPEELLADNLEMLILAPQRARTPELLDAIRAILAR